MHYRRAREEIQVSDLLDDVLSFVELASQQGWLISDNANREEKVDDNK